MRRPAGFWAAVLWVLALVLAVWLSQFVVDGLLVQEYRAVAFAGTETAGS